MPRKRKSASAVFDVATDVASEIHQHDQAVEEQAEIDRAQKTTYQLSRIKSRQTDTRPLNESHVKDLVESIGALGLIEPLVIDTKGRLLAGAHRLAAITVLKDSAPKFYEQHFPGNQIPVRLMAFDAEIDEERALQVELAENEKRVNYSRDQIERLAERLRGLNYRETKGRPKQGEKALGPALAVAIGVSTRYVRRVLGEQKNQTKAGEAKNRNSVPIFERRKILKRLESNLQALLELPESESATRQDKSLDKAAATLLAKIQDNLEK